MGKVTRKLPQPDTDTDMDQQTSSSNEKMTTPYQPRSRDGSKVLKTTIKVKRPIKKSLNKKVLNKTTNSVRRPKKARGTILFGHYHRLNERLNQREARPETSVIPAKSPEVWWLRNGQLCIL
uniref:Uncharacterized protein n=1 Tax=Felis catus TaxID=9685 RepID=A0ABI7WHW8_FELCA